MDEAWSIAKGRRVPVADAAHEAREEIAAGRAVDEHAYMCPEFDAGRGCRCPLQLIGYGTDSKVEAHFKSCKKVDCVTNAGHAKELASRPSALHAGCDFGAAERDDRGPDENSAEIDRSRVRLLHGAIIGPRHAAAATSAESAAGGVGVATVKKGHSNWRLWRVLTELRHYKDARGALTAPVFEVDAEIRDIDSVFFDVAALGGLRPLGERFHLMAPGRYAAGTDFSETKHVFFGPARLKPRADSFAEIEFDARPDIGPVALGVRAFLDEGLRDKSHNVKRLVTAMADLGWTPAAPRPVECYAFVFGTLRRARGALRGLTIEPARSFEDVWIMRVADGRDLMRPVVAVQTDRRARRAAAARDSERLAAEGREKREREGAAARPRPFTVPTLPRSVRPQEVVPPFPPPPPVRPAPTSTAPVHPNPPPPPPHRQAEPTGLRAAGIAILRLFGLVD
jgi:hypothetical protein